MALSARFSKALGYRPLTPEEKFQFTQRDAGIVSPIEPDGYHNPGLRRYWLESYWHDFFQDVGDRRRIFSPGLGAEVWHFLVSGCKMKYLLVLHIVVETFLIFFFALLLLANHALQCEFDSGNDPDLQCSNGASATNATSSPATAGAQPTSDVTLKDFLLLSLSTAGLGTELIFGWSRGQRKLLLIEAILLVVENWSHWLLLTVAAAVIVARALTPMQQVAFSHCCALSPGKLKDSDEDALYQKDLVENGFKAITRPDEDFQEPPELVIRMTTIRPDVLLIQPKILLQMCTLGGQFKNLELKVPEYARWDSAAPMTIRHTVNSSSPLHGEMGLKLMNFITISLATVDQNGLSIAEHQQYFSPLSFTKDRVQKIGDIEELETKITETEKQISGAASPTGNSGQYGTQIETAVDSAEKQGNQSSEGTKTKADLQADLQALQKELKARKYWFQRFNYPNGRPRIPQVLLNAKYKDCFVGMGEPRIEHFEDAYKVFRLKVNWENFSRIIIADENAMEARRMSSRFELLEKRATEGSL